jgi:hypothetical protein
VAEVFNAPGDTVAEDRWDGTPITLTSTAGRQAFEQHVAALQRILARSQPAADTGSAAEAARGILRR